MRYLLILLWLLLGPGYYFLAKQCGQISEPSFVDEQVHLPVASTNTKTIKETPCPKVEAFAFNRGSADLIKLAGWDSYKDSLLALLNEEKKIQIVGLVVEGESNVNDFGMLRAKAISSAMGVPEESLQLYSSNIAKVNFKYDCKMPGARIKLVTVTEKIKEVQDRTLIYFPYNSTNKLNDDEVETYLDALAIQVIKTGEQIRLTGHTDNKGEPKYNLELGQSRAEVIKDYLIFKKVPDENIFALSEGETKPISENTTEEGRAENRRTELEIIKKEN